MALEVTREGVWAVSLADQPGSLAGKLELLAAAGVNLTFVIARRDHAQVGRGVVFVTGIVGGVQEQAALEAGFAKTESLHSVRVEGPDEAGLAASVTGALGKVGLNLRGYSAAALGDRAVMHLAFDTDAEASKAVGVLERQV